MGLEERGDGDDVTLLLYAPQAAAERVRRAAADAAGEGDVGPAEPVPQANWPETWKQGLTACEISPRLVVRPSFVAFTPRPGQAELVIDPGQAFGTGAHESTRLALEWVDALAPGLPPDARVLDVGCGSGVLALAVLKLSRARAVACDLDPLATRATRDSAGVNGLERRIAVFRGSVAAVRAGRFDLVLANLLRSELEPVLPALAASARPDGAVVLSGLLEAESDALERSLEASGLRREGMRRRDDASGVPWCAWLTRR